MFVFGSKRFLQQLSYYSLCQKLSKSKMDWSTEHLSKNLCVSHWNALENTWVLGWVDSDQLDTQQISFQTSVTRITPTKSWKQILLQKIDHFQYNIFSYFAIKGSHLNLFFEADHNQWYSFKNDLNFPDWTYNIFYRIYNLSKCLRRD